MLVSVRFSDNSPPRGSLRVRVMTPRRGSVWVRNAGQCQFSNFRFNSRVEMS